MSEQLFTVTYHDGSCGGTYRTYAKNQCESWASSLVETLTKQGLQNVAMHAQSDDGLTPQLIGLEGWRVEVVTVYGETRRFNVGKSTGWRPCHIEVYNTRSSGGPSAEKEYALVTPIRRIR